MIHPHSKLVNDILLASNKFMVASKNPSGTGRCLTTNNIVRYGLFIGGPDIVGFLKSTTRNSGKLIGIECKTGKAVQTKDQLQCEKIFSQHNAIYIVARSVEDFFNQLNPWV